MLLREDGESAWLYPLGKKMGTVLSELRLITSYLPRASTGLMPTPWATSLLLLFQPGSVRKEDQCQIKKLNTPVRSFFALWQSVGEVPAQMALSSPSWPLQPGERVGESSRTSLPTCTLACKDSQGKASCLRFCHKNQGILLSPWTTVTVKTNA